MTSSKLLSILILASFTVIVSCVNHHAKLGAKHRALERVKSDLANGKFSEGIPQSDQPIGNLQRPLLKTQLVEALQNPCCTYSNPELPDLLSELNQWLDDSSDGTAFGYGSGAWASFIPSFPDYETEAANNVFLAYSKELRQKVVEINGLGTLETIQFSPYLAELDYFIDLIELDARWMQHSMVYWDFGWTNEPWMTVADSIPKLFQHSAQPDYVEKVLEWLTYLDARMDRYKPFAERALAAQKVHASVVIEWQYDLEYGPYGFKYAFSADFNSLCESDVFTGTDLTDCQNLATSLEAKQADFLDWFNTVYRPACAQIRSDETPGLWVVPDGQEIYDILKKYYLGYVSDDKEVYDLGVSGVEEVLTQYADLGAQLGEDLVDADAVIAALGNPNDERFYICTDNPQDAIDNAALNLMSIVETLPTLFGFLPRMSTRITSTGSGSTSNSVGSYDRTKKFWTTPSRFNVGRLGTCGEVPTTAAPLPQGKGKKQKGKGNVEPVTPAPSPQKYYYDRVAARSTAAHEGPPGHQTQVPLSREVQCAFSGLRPNVMFREGWGLHAEWLGNELGIYDEPLHLLGHYQSRAFRDNRLREDTCLNSNTPGVPHCSTTEAMQMMMSVGYSEQYAFLEMERYLIMAGQALAYRLGDIRLQGLRADAESALGPDFDVREFYNVILRFGGGDIETELRPLVETWIKYVKEETILPTEFGADIIPSQLYSTANPFVGLGVCD